MAAEASSTTSGETLDIERGLIRTTRGYMHYRAAGSGRPIFMIHTQHRSSEMFLPILRFLAPEYRCYAMDLPCCGFSDHPKKELTLEDYTASVHEVVHALGLRDFVAMGQARGALLSAELAATEPGLVRGLILQSFPFWPSHEYMAGLNVNRKATVPVDESGFPLMLTLKDMLDPSISKTVNRPRNPTQEWVDEENRHLVLTGRDLWNGLDASGPLAQGTVYDRVTCPTLLLWGKDFRYARYKEEIIKKIKNHRVVLIPEADFFLHLDQPDLYREAVTSFLKELP